MLLSTGTGIEDLLADLDRLELEKLCFHSLSLMRGAGENRITGVFVLPPPLSLISG